MLDKRLADLKPRRLIAALLFALLLAPPALAVPIDTMALVRRRMIELDRIDPHSPLMLGNGDLGATAHITGRQTRVRLDAHGAHLLANAEHAGPEGVGYRRAADI